MKKIKFIIGILISYLLPIAIIISETGTLTQGRTNEFVISGFYSIIILIIFFLCIRKEYKSYSYLWPLGLYHIISIFTAFTVMPKYLYYTTIKGISPCIVLGDYNAIHTGSWNNTSWQMGFSFSDRLFPLEIFASLLIISVYFVLMIFDRYKKCGNNQQ